MASKHETKPTMDIPILDSDGKNYDNWKLRIEIWSDVSKVKKSEQARMLQSKLGETAFDTTKHMDINVLKSDVGVEELLKKLDELYIPDKLHYGRQVFDKYKGIVRRDNETVIAYIQRFLSLYKDVNKFNPDMPFYGESWAAYDLLNSSKLSPENKKIVTAQMQYPPVLNNLTDILKRVFTAEKVDDISSNLDHGSTSGVFVANSASNQNHDANRVTEGYDGAHNAFYTRDNRRNTFRSNQRGNTNMRGRSYRERGFTPYNRNNNRNYGNTNSRKNKVGRDGKILKCRFCDSEYHLILDCTELISAKKDYNSKKNLTHLSFLSFVGCASKNDDKLEALLKESQGYALLDSGCSNTVAGEEWMDNYISSLSIQDRQNIKIEPSNESFTFGDGNSYRSLRKVTFPCWVGGGTADISADIVESKIPLLLSRRSMSKVGMIIDFSKHTAIINKRHVKLKRTQSGHYGLPISL